MANKQTRRYEVKRQRLQWRKNNPKGNRSEQKKVEAELKRVEGKVISLRKVR